MAKNERLPLDNEEVTMDGATYKDLLFKAEWYDAYMQNRIPTDRTYRNWIYTDNRYDTQACNIDESCYDRE